jgi:hypothetical protein
MPTGVALVSGYSPSIMKAILDGESVDLYAFLLNLLSIAVFYNLYTFNLIVVYFEVVVFGFYCVVVLFS